MSAKTDKMYNKSPKMGTDEKGRPAVKRDEKKSDKKEGGKMDAKMEVYQKHSKERLALHHRHEAEHAAMANQQMSEGSPAEEAAESPAEAAAEGDK